jgi:hypothetical protein
VEPESAQPFGQVSGADRLAGTSAREQPRRVSRIAKGGVSPAGRDELADEGCEGFGQDDGFATQPEP